MQSSNQTETVETEGRASPAEKPLPAPASVSRSTVLVRAELGVVRVPGPSDFSGAAERIWSSAAAGMAAGQPWRPLKRRVRRQAASAEWVFGAQTCEAARVWLPRSQGV